MHQELTSRIVDKIIESKVLGGSKVPLNPKPKPLCQPVGAHQSLWMAIPCPAFKLNNRIGSGSIGNTEAKKKRCKGCARVEWGMELCRKLGVYARSLGRISSFTEVYWFGVALNYYWTTLAMNMNYPTSIVLCTRKFVLLLMHSSILPLEKGKWDSKWHFFSYICQRCSERALNEMLSSQ